MQTEQTAALIQFFRKNDGAVIAEPAIGYFVMEDKVWRDNFKTRESQGAVIGFDDCIVECPDIGWRLATKPAGAADSTEPAAWTPGPNAFKDWCARWFGPDSDDTYLAKAVFDLPPMAQRFRAAAEAVPPASCAPAGFKLVPIEPTPAMVLAYNVYGVPGGADGLNPREGPPRNLSTGGYRDMIAAAPDASNAAEPAGGEASTWEQEQARFFGVPVEQIATPPQAPAVPAKWIDDPNETDGLMMVNPAWLEFQAAVPSGLGDAPIEFKTFSVYADTEFRDADGKLMAVVSSGKHHKRMTTALRAALAASAPGAKEQS